MQATKVIRPHAGFQEKFVRSNVDVVIGGGQLGGGKLNPLYTRVLTPQGWIRMGDLRVGDLVCTPFGSPSKVLQIFEHKNKDIYRVTTSDGRQADCGLEHLWAIRTEKQKTKYNKHKDCRLDLTVCDTNKLIEMLRNGDKAYIPIPYAQEFATKDLAVRPYALGRLLRLNAMALGTFIPAEHLNSSIAQRRALLFGLIDTDEYIGDKNTYSFATASRSLMQGFVELCRSLGYIANVNCNTNGAAYNVKISTDDHVYIKSIENIGVSDARCIYIEDDTHLYIIDDYITTHNTFGAILACAESTLDPHFRAVFLRNNLDDLKSGGGVLDSFRECFGAGASIIESGNPRVDFASGASIDVTHVADQSKKKLEQRFKGRQYDMIYYDELTGFTWDCFSFLFSRNRGQGTWTGKVRATTNPKKSHWLRTFLDWYIGPDGEIREDREGVVRYFYNAGATVKEVVWGDSYEEVYQKAKVQIDRFLHRINGKHGKATYKDVIKSFTFYLGRTSENKSLGSGYAASVAAMGGKMSEENAGNWNIDTEDNESAALTMSHANQVLMNDPQTNGDRWVTADLADVGTDNFLCLAWDGFHVIDTLILGHTTPRQNAERLEMFADSHGVANNHIIYDGTRALYINDYIPEAIPFISGRSPMGMYARMAIRLKDECYLRLVEMIKRGFVSISDNVANRIYEHQLLKESITFANEFIEECLVVAFKEVQSGKRTLLSKKEMNAKLGKGRSMDVLDPFAMRMLPVLEYPYGEELEKSADWGNSYEDYDDEDSSIYSDSMWC